MNDAEIARALGAALALGLPAFPCRRDKAPACPHGFRDATANPVGLHDLWRRHPGPLVGVPTGEASGLDVLDIDAPRHPEAAIWFAARRDRLRETRIHRTRSRGLHVLFRHEAGLRCWTGRPVPGVDGRADGGYVVWWPAGGERVICGAPLAPWPEWLLGELIPPTAIRPAWPPATMRLALQPRGAAACRRQSGAGARGRPEQHAQRGGVRPRPPRRGRITRATGHVPAPPWPDLDLSILAAQSTPAPSFPEVLPAGWEKWASDEAEAAGCAVDYVALPLLASGGTLIGNARWGQPWPGWREPPALFTGLIGRPSSGKSPGLDVVTSG